MSFLMMSFLSPPKPILSPCIGVCQLDAEGLCEGCRRSGDEIARWLGMTDAERRHLMDDVLPLRTAQASR